MQAGLLVLQASSKIRIEILQQSLHRIGATLLGGSLSILTSRLIHLGKDEILLFSIF